MNGSPSPVVSVVMKIKNGMPFLPEALASLAAQTYRNFELVVQDGGSTDGSLSVLEQYSRVSTAIPLIRLESGKDAGTADAFNRAVARCHGQIIGSLDCDNKLEKSALETIVARFAETPDACAIYTAQNIIRADGSLSYVFYPEAFNVLDLLECRLVPPFGSSFFNASIAKDKLITDASLKTCEDFSIWLNCVGMKIVMTRDVLVSTRMSSASMTFRPGTYEQLCNDKVASLARFFDALPKNELNSALFNRAIAGVYVWAAESLYFYFPSESGRNSYSEYIRRARAADPVSPRIKEFEVRVATSIAEEVKAKTIAGVIRGAARRLRASLW